MRPRQQWVKRRRKAEVVRARSLLAPLLVALCPALAGVAAGCRGAGAQAPGELRVRRGPVQPRLLLTGELVAARAESLTVPSTPTFQLQIRWLAEDGTMVAAGQPVVSFDNTTFVSQLEEKRRTAVEARSELLRLTAEGARSVEEKRFSVEQKRAELDKARTTAEVPEDLLPRREFQDNQLKLLRAETELAKAERDLTSARQAAASDLAVQRIALGKAEHEVQAAESAVDKLTLRAPRAGIVLAASHPWEGRKLREGDNVWIGMTVATLPEISSMEVQAALSDVDDGRVGPGMQAACTLDAYPAESFSARVVEVSPVARESDRNPLLRYFPVRLQLLHGDLRRMRPGMSVRVEVAEPAARDALVVPRAALDLDASPPRVLLAGGSSVPVRLGPCTAFDCAVTPARGGLAPGRRLRAAAAGGGGTSEAGG
jgi:biotin carboxyl carrier protein